MNIFKASFLYLVVALSFHWAHAADSEWEGTWSGTLTTFAQVPRVGQIKYTYDTTLIIESVQAGLSVQLSNRYFKESPASFFSSEYSTKSGIYLASGANQTIRGKMALDSAKFNETRDILRIRTQLDMEDGSSSQESTYFFMSKDGTSGQKALICITQEEANLSPADRNEKIKQGGQRLVLKFNGAF